MPSVSIFGGAPRTVYIILRQTFTGDGSDKTFQLTSSVGNCTFNKGSWSADQIATAYPAHITGTDKQPTYDSTNLITRNRVAVSSIDASGLVTLDYAPRNEVTFYVWYWYELSSNDEVTYYREDFVASMEEQGASIAGSINVDVTNFNNFLSAADTTVQAALETLDDILTSSELSQLQNINAVTITNTQWGYVGAMDQGVATTNSPSFSALSLGTGELTAGSVNRASGSLTLEIGGTAYLTVANTGISVTGNITAISGLTASRLVAADASKGLESVADLTTWLAGTANQVSVGDDGDGTATISLEQDIATGSSPTFTGLTLSGLTASRLVATGAGSALESVADLASWVAGTSNRITVANDGDGTITLSAPQDIHTGASPTFVALTLSQAIGTAPMTITSTTVVTNLNADLLDGQHGSYYAVSGGAEHDGFSDFVANEHIDHTSVTLTAGDGLTGGGDISANRTFAVGAGTGITVSADAVSLSHLGLESLTDPGADKILFWDDSETVSKWLGVGNSIAITTTTLDTIQDIRTSASPTFTGLSSGNVFAYEEQEDETGASWGPVYHGLSLADNQAFFRVEGVDLSPYADADNAYFIEVHDSAGKIAKGYMDVAGGGETLGSQLAPTSCCTDPDDDQDNTTGWVVINGSIASVAGGETGYCLELTTGSGYPAYFRKALTLEVGKLYKITYFVKAGTESDYKVYFRAGGAAIPTSAPDPATDEWVSHSIYIVVWDAGVDLRIASYAEAESGGTIYFDNISVKEVTDCATDGIRIVQAKGSATQSWADIEDGFNYNGSSYTFEVYKPLELGAGVDSVSLYLSPFDAYFTGDVTLGGNLILPDAGYIGTISDPNAIQIEADGDVVLTQDLSISGTGLLYVGADDTTVGTLTLYGGGTGADGGVIKLHLGADDDATISYYGIQIVEDDLLIGPNTDTDALKLDSNKDLYLTDGDLYVQSAGANGVALFGNGSMSLGINDSQRGQLYIYGDEGGETNGGIIWMYTSADHDTTIDNYRFTIVEDDLTIGPSNNTDLFKIDGGAGVVCFGTYAAKVSEAFAGYITIKDEAGNDRKVMICE